MTNLDPQPDWKPLDVGEVVEVFRRWLYLPDPRQLLALLGTVAANRLEGDPVWLLLVGPPGGGKSELLQSIATLPNVRSAATLTAPALLSGTARRERDPESKGGLLRSIGDFGILLCKDFGSVLSMHRDERAQVLAALREIYDGSWTRHVGVDGGRSLEWRGKVGLVAGCTPTIDRHHAVMGAMGERFVLMRLPEVDSGEQARRALAHAGREREMRSELAAAVARLFLEPKGDPTKLSEQERERLISLTTLVVRCRSAVERDSHTREVELIPGSEAPTRLVVVLERLLSGLDVLGVERAASWEIVTRVALDSMPALRRAVIQALFAAGEEIPTPKLAEAVRHPTQTSRRAVEDLTAHGIAERVSRGEGRNADTWALTTWARQHYADALCVPEMSEEGQEPFNSLFPTYDDFSGTQDEASANGRSKAASPIPDSDPAETMRARKGDS
jgi:hypothetical protein